MTLSTSSYFDYNLEPRRAILFDCASFKIKKTPLKNLAENTKRLAYQSFSLFYVPHYTKVTQ